MERRKEAGTRQPGVGAQLEEAVAVVGMGIRSVERPVARDDVDISAGIGGRTRSGHPDPAEAAVRCRIEENRRLREICRDRKSTRLNSSHLVISYAVFCLKKKKDAPLTSSQIVTFTSAHEAY